jgi:hypothetical protein
MPTSMSLRWDGGCRLKFWKNFIDQRSLDINDAARSPTLEAVSKQSTRLKLFR